MDVADAGAQLNRATFAPHLGSTFRVAVTGGVVELTLTDVTELRVAPGRESFSIEFRGPAAQLMAHDEFSVEHDVIGQFSLFLGPVERDGDELIYEAVFNRVLPKS